MVDGVTDSRGWPKLGTNSSPPATGLTSDRHRQRAEDRAEAARLRADSAQVRAEERATARQTQVADRERQRTERRDAEEQVLGLRAAQLGIDTGLQLTVKRRRRSGSDEKASDLQPDRDTTRYRTVVDADRVRAFAARGVSIAGIATAFGISIAEVEAVIEGTHA